MIKVPTFKIFVRGIILDEQNRVLLIKKSPDQKIAAGRWLLPGGATEFGEQSQETLRRELQEEINFAVTEEKLVGTKTILLGDVHWVGLYFQVRGDLSTIQNLEPQKHSALEWISLDHLPADFDDLERKWISESF